MRTIKVKYPFTSEKPRERQKVLLEITKSLTKDETFAVIEIKHYRNVSYMIVVAEKKNIAVENN